ncbi:MAG TPA: hypothetical protein VMS92_24900 [Mycobacterium sp.]|nr:hypothetical protein [Mycobacterium sp.]
MVTVDTLRAVVRTQTQTDESDLPDATIDVYLQQAFERTLNGETRWPFYAQTWDLVLDPGAATMQLAGDVNVPGIMALTDKTNGVRLGMVPQVWAEDRFVATAAGSAGSMLYSVWGSLVYLWPAPAYAEERSFRLRGYRQPVEWLTADLSPDCDWRLHLPLTHYAVALAYAQQEDEVLEATYMTRWQQDVELAHRAIMDPIHQRPLVMSATTRFGGSPGQPWTVALPPFEVPDEVPAP